MLVLNPSILIFIGSLLITLSVAQINLYSSMFPLGDITLGNGPFKDAQTVNGQTLLEYNADRLLQPYFKEAGLTAKGAAFTNWAGLDGHVGGHYISALAMHYAATGNTQIKQRLDYVITELQKCQNANGSNANFVGYLSGVPNGKTMWLGIKGGNPGAQGSYWVPWYNIHKTYAGLRDAWLYAGSETAKTMFIKLCDWGLTIIGGLNDSQMESMMGTEYGGMNEVYADAYAITKDVKYLNAAKKWSHKWLLNAMAASNDNLDNKHANTQVPKAIGFQRIAELSGDQTYTKAAQFFWSTVTGKRSLAIGGNSRTEFFPDATKYKDFVEVREGPESCNTYNMLKLTEGLFRMSSEVKYLDFYERALFNHILSTIHPTHGGYVYFTPARPRHYRVYSDVNSAMWCCVGSGMENPGKYTQFAYMHKSDSLFVNLFLASELNWKDRGVKVKQETTFPYEEKTKLTITTTGSSTFRLMIRHPSWVASGKMKVIVGTDTVSAQTTPSSYASINRTWSNGDVVTVLLPMQTTVEALPNLPSYVALLRGPIVLGAKTGTESMTGLVADDGRWSHIAGGSLLALDQAPILASTMADIPSKLVPIPGKPMTYKAPNLFRAKKDSSLTLEPFYRIHDSRYMMYWMLLTDQAALDSLAAEQKAAMLLDARTIDRIAPGEQQPEADHLMQTLNSTTGTNQGEFYRDAGACSGGTGGYISYVMSTKSEEDLSLMVRYWGNESCTRKFDILIDGQKLASEDLEGKWNKNEFVNQVYEIPNSLIAGKKEITVRFEANSGMIGGLYYLRLLRKYAAVVGPDGEYIRNGTFAAGSSDWQFNVWGGAATGSVTNGEYTAKVTTVATNAHSIQLVQPGLVLEKGKTYRVSFTGYASAARDLLVNLGMAQDPWTSYLSPVKSFSLSTAPKTYTFDFTMEAATDTNARFEFHFGLQTPQVFIDDVSLKLVEAPSIKAPPIASPQLTPRIRADHHQLEIDFSQALSRPLALKIYNLQGVLQQAASIPSGSRNHKMDIHTLPPGMYILKAMVGGNPQWSTLLSRSF